MDSRIIKEISFIMNRNSDQKEKFIMEFNRIKDINDDICRFEDIILEALTYDFSMSSNQELKNIISLMLNELTENNVIDLYKKIIALDEE
jgi:hypothetical protein